MSTIQQDFDRIALASPDGSLQNNHYHNFLLRRLPSNCQAALEIGCGKGEFSHRLAEKSERVLALDLSPEMIRLAREHSSHHSNIDFQIADVMSYDLRPESLDCIASLATLHHLPLRAILFKMKAALKPGGVLLILDLFEPLKWHGHAASTARQPRGGAHPARDAKVLSALNSEGHRRPAHDLNPHAYSDDDSSARHNQTGLIREGLLDTFLNFVAMPVSVSLRVIHHGRVFPRREARAAWAAHEKHDIYPTMNEVRALCAEVLPGAKVTKHLLWRYSVVWQKRVDGKPADFGVR